MGDGSGGGRHGATPCGREGPSGCRVGEASTFAGHDDEARIQRNNHGRAAPYQPVATAITIPMQCRSPLAPATHVMASLAGGRGAREGAWEDVDGVYGLGDGDDSGGDDEGVRDSDGDDSGGDDRGVGHGDGRPSCV